MINFSLKPEDYILITDFQIYIKNALDAYNCTTNLMLPINKSDIKDIHKNSQFYLSHWHPTFVQYLKDYHHLSQLAIKPEDANCVKGVLIKLDGFLNDVKANNFSTTLLTTYAGVLLSYSFLLHKNRPQGLPLNDELFD